MLPRWNPFGQSSTTSSSSNKNHHHNSTTNSRSRQIRRLSTPNIDELNLSTLTGEHPPPIYEAALIGNWNELLKRLQSSSSTTTSPSSSSLASSSHTPDILYQDKCLNTVLHLACRRQPPPHVVVALIRAECAAMGYKSQLFLDGKLLELQRNGKHYPSEVNLTQPLPQVNTTVAIATPAAATTGVGSTSAFNRRSNRTMDGLTPLHFACYCGASRPVIDMLILYEQEMEAASSSTTSPVKVDLSVMNRLSLHSVQNDDENNNPKSLRLLDRRGRTPLHCTCAGFRTKHRFGIVYALLLVDPESANLPDEKGRTPFTLMYDDYAEEIEEAVSSKSVMEARKEVLGGNLKECWSILMLLLKSTYLGSIEDSKQQPISVMDDQETHQTQDSKDNIHRDHKKLPSLDSIDSDQPMSLVSQTIAYQHPPPPKHSYSLSDSGLYSENQDQPKTFRLLHAACSAIYTCPIGFFQLIFKVLDVEKLKERDAAGNLPLHLALSCIKTLPSSSSAPSSDSTKSFRSTSMPTSITSSEADNIIITYREHDSKLDASSSSKHNFYSQQTFSYPMYTSNNSVVISHLLQLYPDSASIPQPSSGKYPILLAIDHGQKWKNVIEPILKLISNDVFTVKDGSSTSMMEDILVSLKIGLTSEISTIRHETIQNIGHIMNFWSDYLFTMKVGDSHQQQKQQQQHHSQKPADKFVRGLIELFETQDTSREKYSSKRCDKSEDSKLSEIVSIQSTILYGISKVFYHASREMIDMNITTKLALDLASDLLKSECELIQKSASCLLSSVLYIMDSKDLNFAVIQRVIFIQKCFSTQYNAMKREDSSDTLQSMLTQNTAQSADSKAGFLQLKEETASVKQGRAIACFRVLYSTVGETLSKDCPGMYVDIIHVIKHFMEDDSVVVRKAGCLAMGSALGRASDGATYMIKDLRHTILKCMRATENIEVHKGIACGLIISAKMRPNLFLCKVGTPILEAALMLGVTGPKAVQQMFLAFLWLALGIGCEDNEISKDNEEMLSENVTSNFGVGLAQYMALAEGENGKIMMGLATKILSQIEDVRFVLDEI